jgi:hypothetical protein
MKSFLYFNRKALIASTITPVEALSRLDQIAFHCNAGAGPTGRLWNCCFTSEGRLALPFTLLLFPQFVIDGV